MENNYKNRYILETGIGLQDVDRLKNSSYFIKESERYLKGEISLDELDNIVNSYYENKPAVGDRSEEADKISIRIARIINEVDAQSIQDLGIVMRAAKEQIGNQADGKRIADMVKLKLNEKGED